ncbi:GFA family protein [Sulfitobacter sp. 1A13496]|uniref:GFA family protein n=1 Tax=Sulfitobacter sp. 1A13496 TaxID=3368596 RepID=UPI003744E0D4
MTETSETRRASCHCGAVVIEALFPRGLASAARCTCSFCRRRAAATVTALAGTVTVLKGAENLTLYTWGTHTAKHYFCKTCGIYTHHRRRSNPDECGVNLGAIEEVLPWEMEPLPYSDGIDHPSDRDPG